MKLITSPIVSRTKVLVPASFAVLLMLPLPVAATPEQIIGIAGAVSGFDLYGKGLLIWSGPGVCSGEFPVDGRVYSRFNEFGSLKTLASDCTILNDARFNAVRDEAYVYYFGDRWIRRKPLNAGPATAQQNMPAPLTMPILAADQKSTPLAIGDNRLLWGRYDSSDGSNTLYYLTLSGSQGGSLRKINGCNAPVKEIEFYNRLGAADGRTLLILLTNGRLYRYFFDSDSVSLLDTGIVDFAHHDVIGLFGNPSTNYVYAAEGTDSQVVSCLVDAGKLRRINLLNNQNDLLYTAPGNSQIVSLAVDPGNSGGFVTTPRRIYIAEAGINSGGFFCTLGNIAIKRNRLTSASDPWDTLCLQDGGFNLHSDGHWLYFSYDSSISRLDADAPPVLFDLAAIHTEIVQTVQDWGQNAVIISNKEGTTVRGYAKILTNNTTQSSVFPHATLEVTIDGAPIEGSPFDPVNNTRVTAEDDLMVLRADRERSFIFELPKLGAGEMTATLTVNPNANPAETGASPLANNTVSRSITVQPGYNPCIVMVPMPTPYGKVTTYGQAFADILNRAESILPVGKLDWRNWGALTEDHGDITGETWFPNGSYNFDDDDDDQDNDALDAIDCVRESSSWPSSCKITHWVGMIHPGVTGFGGLGYRPGRSIIASWNGDPGDGLWDDPFGGTVVAHELGHNYGRRHVNCGGPANTDSSYPYPNNQMGLNVGTGHFGYDPITGLVVAPTFPDLMSYCSPSWVSDYTWNAIYANVLFSATFPLPSQPRGGEPTSPTMFVSGRIDAGIPAALFSTFYTLPKNEWDSRRLSEAAAASSEAANEPDPYVFEFVGQDGTPLEGPALPVKEASDGPADRLSFTHYTELPAQTRLIRLKQNGQTLAERLVSGNAPTITLGAPIVEPAAEAVSINWAADDADGDVLFFIVQYSTDGGITWMSYRVNYPATAITMDARVLEAGVPGGSRIRVIASDGVNSDFDVSSGFTIPNHAPQAFIGGVREGAQVPFASDRVLVGMGHDVEDGRDDVSRRWDIAGPCPVVGIAADRVPLRCLAPGSYAATLSVTDRKLASTDETRNFEILPMTVPDGSPVPVVDGLCADEAYVGSRFFCVEMDGRTIPIRMLHADGGLFVSFSNLPLATPRALPVEVGMCVDTNGDGGGASASDRGFFVNQDGVPSQLVGSGGAMVNDETPGLGFTAEASIGGSAWCAEFRINESLLGGWNHAMRFSFSLKQATWPATANKDDPATWSTAWLQAELPPQANHMPYADAGPDLLINLVGPAVVTLNGDNSHDPDGDPLNWSWTQVGGPVVILVGADTMNPSFVGSGQSAERTFQLRVSDGIELSAPDLVTVRTKMATLPDNSKPAPLVVLEDDGMHVRYTGLEPGVLYTIQASSDLILWEDIGTNTADWLGTVDILDIEAESFEKRFYRLAW